MKPDASPVEPLPVAAEVPADEGEPSVKVPLAFEDWLAVLTMGALCLITFINVVVRYLTNQSFAWTEEISVFLMIVLTLSGGCAAMARDRHIKIEYFQDSGSAERKRKMVRFGAFCSLVFFLLLAGLSVRLVWDDIRYGETTPGIGVPQWWYSIWLPVLSFAIALRALGVFMRGAKVKRGPR
jgi:TRAP-type C4-dicarboxylate transport system permease small subunit